MRCVILIILAFIFTNLNSQELYDKQIEKFADDVISYFDLREKKIKVGLMTLVYNGKETKLTRMISEDFSAEILINKNVQGKIILIKEVMWKFRSEIKKSANEHDKIVVLSKLDIVDYLISCTITDNENGYKLQMLLYETKLGNVLNAAKVYIPKSVEFESLNSLVIDNQNLDSEELNEIPEANIKSKKKEKKGDSKFWKAMGDLAINSVEQVVNTTIDQQISKIGDGDRKSRSAVNVNKSDSLNGQNDIGEPRSNIGSDCKAYINFINNTGYLIQVRIYNSRSNMSAFSTRPIYSFTIASGKYKKQRVEKDIQFSYSVTTNINVGLGGEIKDWNGTFLVEDCETVDEEIE